MRGSPIFTPILPWGLARRLIKDPGSRLNINGWADAVGVSRRTLTRLFRAQTGLAFAPWRCRLRLLRAVEYHAGGEPLARAVVRVGYNSVAAFQAMARRETGMDFSELCHADTWPGYDPGTVPPKMKNFTSTNRQGRSGC